MADEPSELEKHYVCSARYFTGIKIDQLHSRLFEVVYFITVRILSLKAVLKARVAILVFLSARKRKRGEGCRDLASFQVSSNSIQLLQ